MNILIISDNSSSLERLPQELLAQILSSLSNRELKVARRVCGCWKNISTEMMIRRERFLLNRFFQHIHLNPLVPIPHFKKLSDMNELLLSCRKMATEALSAGEKAKLGKLEIEWKNQQTPQFFENIFILAGACRDTQDILKEQVGHKRASSISNICRMLQGRGEFEMSLDIANRIPNLLVKGVVLEEIAKTLFTKGQIDRAVRIADSIMHQDSKRRSFEHICTGLKNLGQQERAAYLSLKVPQEEDLFTYYDRITMDFESQTCKTGSAYT